MADIGMSVWRSWPEWTGLVLLVLGFIVALSISSLWLNITIIFLAGMLVGRVVYKKKGNVPLFPFMLIVIIFMVGYLLGSYTYNRILILIIFIISTTISYKIHKKRYIP
jgi:predicted membrane protein